MPAEPVYTDQQIAKALTDARGNVSVAARHLGCARITIYRRMETTPALAESREEGRETMRDIAEGVLESFILQKNMSKTKLTATIFYLKTQCASRGYGSTVDGDKLPPWKEALEYFAAFGLKLTPMEAGDDQPQ
jgi:hypothetical protein